MSNDSAENLNVQRGVWLSKEWLDRSPEFKNDSFLRNQLIDGLDSREDHPDFVFLAPDVAKAARQPFNLEIDPKIVDDILKGNIK